MSKPSIAAKICEMTSLGGTGQIAQNTAIINPFSFLAPTKSDDLISQIQELVELAVKRSKRVALQGVP